MYEAIVQAILARVKFCFVGRVDFATYHLWLHHNSR